MLSSVPVADFFFDPKHTSGTALGNVLWTDVMDELRALAPEKAEERNEWMELLAPLSDPPAAPAAHTA